MNETLGYSISIFLAEGRPTALKFVEKSNWNGKGLVCPRNRFKEVRRRTEFRKAGVYLLVGTSDDSSVPVVYIGEGDPVGDRLQEHLRDKDFWHTAYAFVSKDDNLNKAHVQYLEFRLLEIAKQANRCALVNGVSPTSPSLSEAALHETEGFLRETLLCFPVLGVNVFEPLEQAPRGPALFHLDRKGISAQGYESDQGFVVRQGATAVKHVERSMRETARRMRDDLIANKILVERDHFYELTQDYEFASPSTAAGTLVGASINGRDVWKTSDGRSLNEVELQASGALKSATAQ